MYINVNVQINIRLRNAIFMLFSVFRLSAPKHFEIFIHFAIYGSIYGKSLRANISFAKSAHYLIYDVFVRYAATVSFMSITI